MGEFLYSLAEHPDLIGDECERANTYFRGLLAHVNLKNNTEAFQASEVYRVTRTEDVIKGWKFGVIEKQGLLRLERVRQLAED